MGSYAENAQAANRMPQKKRSRSHVIEGFSARHLRRAAEKMAKLEARRAAKASTPANEEGREK